MALNCFCSNNWSSLTFLQEHPKIMQHFGPYLRIWSKGDSDVAQIVWGDYRQAIRLLMSEINSLAIGSAVLRSCAAEWQ